MSNPVFVASEREVMMSDRKNMVIGVVFAMVLVGATIAATGYSNKLLHPLRTAAAVGNTIADVDASSAPEFSAGTWINSEPLKLSELRGRVVLIEFWTFGCYNCRNTLPTVKNWDTKYRDKGLTVVGVHSPELDGEEKIENVRREVASLGIRYPVITDNDHANWKAYGVEGWPMLFLLDKNGRVRWQHLGEGAYDEAE